jgi:hypothetical protein
MTFKHIMAIALCAMAIISCEEETSTIGSSLTDEKDKLVLSTHNFDVLTKSVAVDSVFSRERQCYFGYVRDPETNTYVKSEFTTQFNMMEDIEDDLPKKENILGYDNGEIAADSCVIYIQFDLSSCYGDSLTAMKMRASELAKPVNDIRMHYSNFDPRAEGLIREGGLSEELMFTLTDLTMPDTAFTYHWARIKLNEPYTDKNGKTHNNYGSYILRSYYDHPEYFKNSYSYVNKVCPGFFFEIIDGIGVMAKVTQVDMYIYYKAEYSGVVGYSYLRTTATEEVVQTTKVTNDMNAIRQLAEDNSCTYMKTPAAIFTEVTLPVDEINSNHTSDSLLSAKVTFQRMNNQTVTPQYAFSLPSRVLLIEKDSLDSFFKGNNLYNNIYAYEEILSNNAYTFDNISNLITRMHNEKVKGLKDDPNWTANHPNWNKALLVPIDEVSIMSTSSYNYSYYYSSSTTATSTPIALKNLMGLTSTRLVKGTASNPIKMEVIYAKFKDY